MKKRVVITGLGVVAPNGIGIEEFWKSIGTGKSGIDRITSFNPEGFPTTIAGEVKNFEPLNFMEPAVFLKTDRFAQFGVAAAKMALEDSCLNLGEENRERIGVCIGSGLGGIPFHERQIVIMYEKGLERVHPLAVPKITPNAVSSYISIVFGLKGPNIVVSTACSSGGHAIGLAMDMIRLKRADVVFAGGVEAPLTPYTFGCYCALRVMSKRNNFPQEASRPFDKERDGFVMSEGGGVLILEELSHARKRKAKIYAEVLGYGSTGGAYHMAIPVSDGEDAARAMKLALKDAKIDFKEIDYINAHGTSTIQNDKVETLAIKKVFGKHAYKVPVSSIKSMIGHTIGAAGSIALIAGCLSINKNVIPPTINYHTKDSECDLDYVSNKSRKQNINIVLTNSFGFGNNNACIVIKKYEG